VIERVAFDRPADLERSFERFRRFGDDLLERWDGRTLYRTARLHGRAVPYAVHVDGQDVLLEVDPEEADGVRPLVQRMLVPLDGLAGLRAADPAVEGAWQRVGAIRSVVDSDLFLGLVRAISAQQVNLRWAATTRRRLAEAFGTEHRVAGGSVHGLDVERLAAADPLELRALQFTTAKARSIVGLARAELDGVLDRETLESLPDDEVIARLVKLRGIGEWSAEWTLARGLGRPRVVAGDLGVRKAVGRAYLDGRMPSFAEVRQLTAHWGRAATAAQALLLEDLVRH
jgi:DNA-3-methyladenine glycosylase II